MKNVLGTMNEIESLIRSGYGYHQLLDKLELTEDDLRAIIAEKPAFALVIKSRYGIVLDTNEVKDEPKPLKAKRKTKKQDEQPQQESDEEVTNANEAVSEGE